jgi:hypothetical protein
MNASVAQKAINRRRFIDAILNGVNLFYYSCLDSDVLTSAGAQLKTYAPGLRACAVTGKSSSRSSRAVGGSFQSESPAEMLSSTEERKSKDEALAPRVSAMCLMLK